ncbi:hypothetical protein QE430_002199 [Microbacterium testaceum]|uniref:hypothetical protein n=1 Tax=Microbacterium testaceum TaxID=2033 RepID=UPI0027804634|nr:hypothetical protein [Microbacterium testaceum]MDQ1173892.1 hypothetical protein [Microbacterium testaceum]
MRPCGRSRAFPPTPCWCTSAALPQHTELGDQLLPWAVGLFVVAAGQWAWFFFRNRRQASGTRSTDTRSTRTRVITVAVAVVAIVVAVATTVNVVQAGDSEARATWSSESGS